ncbi:MAG: phosphoglycerate dehydrogenase, partial [Pseudomonadota bacterium]
ADMLYVTNKDRPGFIGAFGSLMGEIGQNIARLNLGRDVEGGDAILLVTLDNPLPDADLAKLLKLDNLVAAHRLKF